MSQNKRFLTDSVVEVLLRLDRWQIELLLTYASNAADNLHDERQAGWELMTSDEDKLQQYGTTDYWEAQSKIDDMIQQIKAFLPEAE